MAGALEGVSGIASFRGGSAVRGFSARVFTRFGGRTPPFHRASAVQATAIVLLTASGACAENGLQVLEEPPASVLSLAPLEANVAGLALIALIALTLIAAAAVGLYVIGRRTWTRRVSELEAELARTIAALRPVDLEFGDPDARPCDNLVIETREEHRRARIALASRPPTQLVVQPLGVMAAGADHV